MKRLLAFGLSLGLVAALAAPALAAPFDNGSFEKDVSIGAFKPLANGSTEIPGWTVGGAGLDWIGTYWTNADGSKSIDLNPSGGANGAGGSISQVIDTVVNATYVVTFAFAGNPTAASTCPNPVKTMTVHATGGPTTGYSFDTTGKSAANMGWEDTGYSFQANGGSATLTFTSTVLGNCGPAIDHVRVFETLPTGAQCKKDGWMSMVDKEGNAFKNQGDCVSYYATGEKNLAFVKDDE